MVACLAASGLSRTVRAHDIWVRLPSMLGRKLLAAAEDWVARQGGRKVKMTVVNVRDTLLAWYARRGYPPTHETKPFPYDDKCFCIPRRDDLQFVVLHRWLFGNRAAH